MTRILWAIAAVGLLAGCVSGQAGVSNTKDLFSYGGQAANKDATESHSWQNTQGKATVSWGGQASRGTFTLTITDDAGKQVYGGTMGPGQSSFGGNTASGTPGEWTILMDFDGFTGQMGLTVMATGGSMGASYPTGYMP